jgi:NADH dehydrogenase FAD-containing subunit
LNSILVPKQDDLKSWYPELAGRIRITLVEALPSVLPMFSKQLIEYTESTFKEEKIEILTKTMVKEVQLLSPRYHVTLLTYFLHPLSCLNTSR